VGTQAEADHFIDEVSNDDAELGQQLRVVEIKNAVGLN
jgi:hypothetical protein